MFNPPFYRLFIYDLGRLNDMFKDIQQVSGWARIVNSGSLTLGSHAYCVPNICVIWVWIFYTWEKIYNVFPWKMEIGTPLWECMRERTEVWEVNCKSECGNINVLLRESVHIRRGDLLSTTISISLAECLGHGSSFICYRLKIF